ncbi:MAG TPA: hypothetical protein ACFCUC_09315 [Desulfobacterales bacterium]
MLSKDKIKNLVDEIIKLGNELRKYHELEDEPAKAYPPPKKTTLDVFKNRFAGNVPPSYLKLMTIYNGIENFEWVDVSILSIEFLMKNENLDESWIEAGAYNEGELFIFAQSDSDAHVVAFLIKKADDKGEMEVVHFDAGGILGRHNNLESYLKDRRNWFKQSLELEIADRDRLHNDE